MALNDITLGQHFGDNFVLDTGLEKILVNVDGVSIVSNPDGTLSAVAEDAAGTAFDPAGNVLTATDTQAAIEEVLGLLNGVQHTVITNVDLQPTGNPNEFTVEIEWTDGDGNTQTTTDPTPVTIAQQTVVSADAGNLVTAGGDGGAFIDSVVSSDAGNLITAGADGLAALSPTDLCQAVTDNCVDDCVVTDMFGNTIGVVLMNQP